MAGAYNDCSTASCKTRKPPTPPFPNVYTSLFFPLSLFFRFPLFFPLPPPFFCNTIRSWVYDSRQPTAISRLERKTNRQKNKRKLPTKKTNESHFKFNLITTTLQYTTVHYISLCQGVNDFIQFRVAAAHDDAAFTVVARIGAHVSPQNADYFEQIAQLFHHEHAVGPVHGLNLLCKRGGLNYNGQMVKRDDTDHAHQVEQWVQPG